MASLTAYMAFTSRGKPFDIKIPNDPRALAAYKKGEEYFYTRRGQLNFSCASCHVQSPGNHIRTEVLAPALGILERACRSTVRNGAAWARPAAAYHLQQPDPRRPAQAGGRRIPRRRILSCPTWPTACRSPAGRAAVTAMEESSCANVH